MRAVWEPQMLSILRIMTGLLFLQHGLAKVFGFPPTPNPRPFDLWTLNPGLQGSLELVGRLLIALGLLTRPVAFILAGDMPAPYLMAHAPRPLHPLARVGRQRVVGAAAERGADPLRQHPPVIERDPHLSAEMLAAGLVPLGTHVGMRRGVHPLHQAACGGIAEGVALEILEPDLPLHYRAGEAILHAEL